MPKNYTHETDISLTAFFGEVDYTVKIGNNKQGYNGAKG